MKRMFYNCDELDNLDISRWNVSNVTDMSYMFYDCYTMKEIDLSHWLTPNVSNMEGMFQGCGNLTRAYLTRFTSDSNPDINNFWWTSADAADFVDMRSFNFGNCRNSDNSELNNSSYATTVLVLDQRSVSPLTGTSKVITQEDYAKLFYNYTTEGGVKKVSLRDDFKYILNSNMPIPWNCWSAGRELPNPITDYNIEGNKYSLAELFYGCTADILNFDLFYTEKVVDMSYMFAKCKLKELNMAGLNTSNVENMEGMFYGYNCSNSGAPDFSSFNTGNVTNMSRMFQLMENYNKIDLTPLNTSQVTDMSYMFAGALLNSTNLNRFDTSGFDTKNVTNMSYMFAYCNVYSDISFSNFDTSNVTNMEAMIYFVDLNNSKLDLSNFDTKNVRNMHVMFSHMYKDASGNLDISNFDTRNVTNMKRMFYANTVLPDTLISNFNTRNATNMNEMFYSSNVRYLDLSNFNRERLDSLTHIIGDMGNLVCADLSSFRIDSIKGDQPILVGSLSNLDKVYVNNLTYNWFIKNNSYLKSKFAIKKIVAVESNEFYEYMPQFLTNSDEKPWYHYIRFTQDFKDHLTSGSEDEYHGWIKGIPLPNPFPDGKYRNGGVGLDSLFKNMELEAVDMTEFNTTALVSMSYMFANSRIGRLDISNFNLDYLSRNKDIFLNCEITSKPALPNAWVLVDGVGDTNLMTGVFNRDVQPASFVKVFYLSDAAEGDVVFKQFDSDKAIPANTPFLWYMTSWDKTGAISDEMSFGRIYSKNDIFSNATSSKELQQVPEEVDLDNTHTASLVGSADGFYTDFGSDVEQKYVLAKKPDDEQPMFYRFNGTKVPQGKACLVVKKNADGGNKLSANALRISFSGTTNDGNATNINTTPAASAAHEGAIYNLQGQRVQAMQKNQIYIVNGKKVSVK